MITNEIKKTFGAHVDDLKSTIIKVILSWAAGIGVSAYFKEEILEFYFEPIRGTILNWHGLIEKMTFLVQIHVFTGFIFSFPFIIMFIWGFVSPALGAKEAKFAKFYFLSVLCLTMIAVIYGYIWLIPVGLRFFQGIVIPGTKDALTASAYLDFITTLFISLIVVFQVPVLVFSLIRTKLVSPDFIAKYRKYVYFLLLVIMMVLIPGDIFTSALVILPVVVLFESAMFLATLSIRMKGKDKEG